MNGYFCVNNCRYKYRYKKTTSKMSDGRKRIPSLFMGVKNKKLGIRL